MHQQKTFLYLYPIAEYLHPAIENSAAGFYKREQEIAFLHNLDAAATEAERENIRTEAKCQILAEFTAHYAEKLNACIDQRYRKNGFNIAYALFANHPVSSLITLRPSDVLISADIDFTTHTTKRNDGTFCYPDPDLMLDQLKPLRTLRIAGFHLGDCVEKVTKAAYGRGLDTIVNEDLTEWFGLRMRDSQFRIAEHRWYWPDGWPDSSGAYALFVKNRRAYPWLLQPPIPILPQQAREQN